MNSGAMARRKYLHPLHCLGEIGARAADGCVACVGSYEVLPVSIRAGKGLSGVIFRALGGGWP